MERSSCERVRAWAALAPDGVLSEIEQRLLDAHLERCGACSAFAVDVDALTERLRAAPLEQPRLPAFRAPRLRRQLRLSYVTASAAAVAAAIVGGTVIGGVATPDRPSSSPPPLLVDNRAVQNDKVLVRQLRDVWLADGQTSTDSARPGLLEG